MSASLSIPLYLFAKAPVPGLVKTRMASEIGHDSCARLAEMMLEDSVNQVLNNWEGPLILAVTPNAEHHLFHQLSHQYGIEFIVQEGADLGARMFNALRIGVDAHGIAAVMGCDVPYIGGQVLKRTHELLTNNGNVIGPAEDGGFYVLGINHKNSKIFDDVVWGQENACRTVIENYTGMGMEISIADTLRDIDTIEDLKWLAERYPKYRLVMDQ